jgi:hypothetical protein
MPENAVPPTGGGNFFEAVKRTKKETKELTQAEKDERSIAGLADYHEWKVFKDRALGLVNRIKQDAKGVKPEESETMCLHRKLVAEAVEDVVKRLLVMVDSTAEHYNKKNE